MALIQWIVRTIITLILLSTISLKLLTKHVLLDVLNALQDLVLAVTNAAQIRILTTHQEIAYVSLIIRNTSTLPMAMILETIYSLRFKILRSVMRTIIS